MNKIIVLRTLALTGIPLIMVACGGGGSNVVGAAPIVHNYTGTSVTVAYSGATLGNPTTIDTGATYYETANSNNILQSATFVAANGNTASFDVANGDTIVQVSPGVNGFANAAHTQSALTAWAPYFGWSYQSFGVWTNGVGTGQVSAGSAGTSTLGASIPTTGSATFTGLAAGLFGNATAVYYATADMSAVTNFATRSIAFATTNSVVSPTINGTYVSAGGLNLSGTLTYAAGTNNFNGTVNSSGYTTMTGDAGGRFYGPTAQEIGGVFAVKSGNYGYIGGFGGKR
jgi:C-lobe and N-lobe beta barrels of Tf-binding protein B